MGRRKCLNEEEKSKIVQRVKQGETLIKYLQLWSVIPKQ